MNDYIAQEIRDSIDTKESILGDKDLISNIANIANIAIDRYAKGNKILVAGNGGSAADAQHIVAELVSRFYFDRDGLPAIALTTDTSILTAIGNDYGYEKLFARQIQANGLKGDIFIAISTSGNSANIIEAIKEAKKREIITVGLTGSRESKMDKLCDHLIKVPSNSTPRIQEAHILIGHIICAIIEEKIFTKKS
ncbi:Phosphoheptose isomerase 1 [hydrothermal vent metagenome]|uniref:D-sedoheptulose-7-phosphate isomerase n=1 Tax=hydrothermal vent metagenome TaxID=652676 RepID=A0A1W1BT19_9ZZZZ